ncbi:polysaccharide deacetylase family protein [[Ruminococcus] torques]|uniref:polysaccharide deacetylase family protein n=1 Tax=[Ruminococcus] torques TaxID=33039 RepID=UPI0025A47970|nr:polysaccharide deacetylase family protein [[Ruminococcus] torques]MDM8236894.1 polysaccharide deacetylase family protein [[Ruminococcus] torques]
MAKNDIRRWMQALALTAVLMAYPVSALWESEEAGAEVKSEASSEIPPKVALTFDDGPSSEYTPLLLDGLRERNVKASFFVIGSNIEKEGGEEIIRRIYEEGHLIGNHTWHHVDLSDLSTEDAWKELEMTDSLIKAITGEETALVRPPFGEFPRSMEEPDKLYVKWTVDSRDWVTKDTQEIVRKVVTDTEENDIILMHDCYETSVEAALQIIDILSERGYEFVTVDRLLLE